MNFRLLMATLFLLVISLVQSFQTHQGWNFLHSSIRQGRISPLWAGDDNFANESSSDDTVKVTAKSLGFDAPATSNVPTSSLSSGDGQSDRLKKSLDDSAKFKIRNDARFTWLSTLAVSGAYAYGCLAPDGREFLEILGIPDGGIAGGIGGIIFSMGSIFLFFAPELFAAKRK